MKTVIVYNLPASANAVDDLDVLVQVESVKKSLLELNHNIEIIGVDLNLKSFKETLEKSNPDIVFNLVEALNGTEAFMHYVPQILESLKIPFTGGSSSSLFITTDKVLTKKMFGNYKIPTPQWFVSNNVVKNDILPPYIIKPISVDASVGLDDESIINDAENINDELKARIEKYGDCFVEEYIDGREFNISVIETKDGPLVLPIAEIKFENYPQEKAKIVNYDAKWNEKSFEYHNTVRSFNFEKEDGKLLDELREVTIKCWNKFELKGYVRIDFRVDKENKIFALEINVNPCISPDSGFYAACEKYGWNYTKMVEIILDAVGNTKKLVSKLSVI